MYQPASTPRRLPLAIVLAALLAAGCGDDQTLVGSNSTADTAADAAVGDGLGGADAGTDAAAADAEPLDAQLPPDTALPDVEPADVEPADVAPADTQPADLQPDASQPDDTLPDAAQPDDALPQDVGQPDAQSDDSVLTDQGKADAEPGDVSEPEDEDEGDPGPGDTAQTGDAEDVSPGDGASGDGATQDVGTPPACLQTSDCQALGVAPMCKAWSCSGGQCVQVAGPQGAACSDGSACTQGDTCEGGACKPAAYLGCDDKNPCTQDDCKPADGSCSHSPVAGFCEDGNACTQGDSCEAGACKAGGPGTCTDNDPCTLDTCNVASGKCEHSPASGACDDGNACTTGDTCQGGKCQGGSAKVCNDGNPCTEDGCQAKTGCTASNNSGPCSDNAKCLLGTCANGSCQYGAAQGCNDGNPCTADTCDGQNGCIYKPIGDGQICGVATACSNARVCKAGQCPSATAVDCNDDNPCTDELCDPVVGCKWTVNKASCQDGNACTAGDVCNNGKCSSGTPVNAKVFCEDANICTDDSCDATKGCVHAANSAPCSDGSPCTVGESCDKGSCKGGSTNLCDDGKPCTSDVCDPKTSACSWVGIVGPCEDGNACTSGDQCIGAECVAGAAPDCSDKEPCTVDACDPKAGCTHTPSPAAAADKCDGTVVGNRCFKAVVANVNWAQGEAACKAWGGHLAKVGSQADNTAIRGVATAVCGANATPWLGGSDAATEGKWLWADGTAMAFSAWAGGQPDNCVDCCDIAKVGEDYLQMWADGHWNDLCASTVLGCSVCERPAPTEACQDPAKCLTGGTCIAGKCNGGVSGCDDGAACTVDACSASGCKNDPVADGTLCGVGVCKSGLCSPGVELANPATSCAAVAAGLPGAKDGLYYIDPDGKLGAAATVQTACAFGLDGGSWTLVAIAADDGQATWTWNARTLWSTNTATFGSAANPAKDFKSPLYHTMPFTDVMFQHAPSLVWAAYHDVGDGKLSMAKKNESLGPNPVCWQPTQGWAMSAGTLAASGNLCSTKLYLNMDDHDGNQGCGDDDQSFGPGWSTNTNAKCPFDDPGLTGGLGPHNADAGNEVGNIGFGQVLNLNKGAAGKGENRMSIWVR